MAIADELIALLGFELSGEDAAKRYENTLKRVEKTAEKVGAAIGTGIKIAAAAGAAAFTFLGKSVIETSAQFETYQATLETIEGSADKARAALDWIADFGKKTPYDVAQVTEAFVKLKAYGIDPIANDTLRILGDTSSAMGKDLNAAVEMFADASTGEFERLKEFGIKAKQEGDSVTFNWTKNGKELSKTVKKNATEIRAFLLETMGDRFNGAMDRQSKTFKGMTSNIGDSWIDFQRRIGESGFFESVNNKLKGLIDTIDLLDKSGKLDQWAAALSKTLTWFADMFWAVGERVASITGWLIDNFERLKPVLIALGAALGALLVWAFPILSAFVAIGLAVDDLIAYFQGGESVIGDFIDWCSRLPSVLATAAGAFKDWLSNINWGDLGRQAGQLLVDGIVGLVVGSVSLLGMWKQTVQSVDWDAVSNVITDGLKAGFLAYADWVYGFWSGVATRINEYVKNAFNIDLIAEGTRLGNDLLTGLKLVGAAIKDWFLGLFQLPEWVQNLGFGPTDPKVVPGAGPAGTGENVPAGPEAPIQFDQDAWDAKMELQRQEWEQMLKNANDNIQKLAPDTAVDATITDARADNRSFPQTNNVTVNQTVTQATDAPKQAAQATAGAVQGAVAQQRSQIETEPSF